MAGFVNKNTGIRAFKLSSLTLVTLFILLPATTEASEPWAKFERTYTPQGAAHLKLSNTNGDITVTAWAKKTVVVRANAAPSVSIQDQVSGDQIIISVKRDLRLGRADFEVFVPADTSVSIKNVMGRIEVQGVSGHVTVDSIDSDVRLADIRAQSVDVKVTSGDISFDGELDGQGPFSLQTLKGDLDVTVPERSSFDLVARALSENINLGAFLGSLTGTSRGPKSVSGTYQRGGARLSLTTYIGRILLRKK
ncbi:MAG TPA: DUF4097 family beta strand repeat-containing protein [Blastocatellia bacterium]|nr:DUF4097 family beta strand repeat-containing protein [Blastocatellia bacterium]